MIARAALVIALTAATAALSGCHATTDARWATPSDTVYHWQHALPTLPVEVRGALPQATTAQIMRALPQATLAPSGDPAAARLVVEAGHASTPVGNQYCAAVAPSQATASGSDLMLTLCDGTRLVGWSHVSLSESQAMASELPRQVDRLETLMLIGIDRSPAQYVDLQQ